MLGNFPIVSGNITINNSALLSGSGEISGSSIALGGEGAVGAAGSGNAIRLSGQTLTINKSAGAVFARINETLVNDGPRVPVSLNGVAMPGGGELTSYDMNLAGPLNSGTSSLTLNTAALVLNHHDITAGSLVFKWH
jgi:hypothetical protein